ncbi:Alpha/Beta hydrolase protein [Macrophomina phaseolina]|uniref:Alpha/Beta hydrolase protein n=1 Tax=Macrophomina phaseolina TaxID=35725 RepID=A0ABQ8G456_9PEZI|nr:Alpha/Beta hydrolase protein [Macrophomina phaseolina]
MPSFPELPLRQTERKVQDGYVRLKDVYIPTRDGSVLCANIYLPTVDEKSAKFPCLLTLGPYGKDVHFAEFGKPQTDMYANMAKAISPLGPDACFEVPDPIVWCKEYKYALVRVDTRGSGGSPGKLDPFGLGRTCEIGRDAEGEDGYDAVEWAGTQDWSNGKVAMCGISYFAMACYWTAMQQPPHLAAIVPYEGLTDNYGHTTRQGGVFHSGFQKHWFNNIVVPQQYGRLEGVDEVELAKARFDFTGLESSWIWRSEGAWPVLDRYRDLRKIKVPLLSAGNWMDSEVHLPGNLVAFEEASSEKFLEMHTGNHLAAYYAPDQPKRQRQFLDYFLLDQKNNGLDQAPQIDLLIRKGAEGFYRREETWPPQDIEYVSAYIAPDDKLSFSPYSATSPGDSIDYAGLTGSTELRTEPFQSDFEILGYPYLDLTVSTDAKDMDLFVYFYLIDASGEKVVFRGNHDEPALSFLRSWFRLSHRTLSEKSTTHRPMLDQQSAAPVKPNELYSVKVPIPPTSMIFEKGTRLAVALRADDEETTIPPMRHVGPDRSEEVFAGKNRILRGGRLVLPAVKRTN